MTDSNEPSVATDAVTLKRLFKAKFGLDVRVNTSQTKSRWITIWLRSSKGQPVQEFPLELRVSLLRFIYPKDRESDFVTRGDAGNIRKNSVAMPEGEWKKFLPTLA